MSVILVVEPDASYGESIASALRSEGWLVEVVADREAALRSASSSPPKLVLSSGDLPGAKELLGEFSKRHGGPGAIVLLPVTVTGHVSATDFNADDVLPKPFSEDDLRQLVQQHLADKEAPARGPEDGIREESVDGSDERLNSAQIFGDVLKEIRQEAGLESKQQAPTVDDELEHRLAQTLSGVFATDLLGHSTQLSRSAKAAKEKSSQEREIDALLDRTLSTLAIPLQSAAKPRPKKKDTASAPGSLEPGTDAFEALSAPLLAADESTGIDRPESPGDPGTEYKKATESIVPISDPATPAASERISLLPGKSGDAQESGLDFGEYTLLRRIATGGMAEVWKARRRGVEGFQKTVAIKKILSHLTGNPDFVTMFIDEAKLAAQLSHNHITQIYDLGKVGDDFYIAMEFVEGKDLRTILTAGRDRSRPMPIELALLVTCRLAGALDYAHRLKDFEGRDLGLVHRDVSPQNVLVSFEGDIKLCDFGIVKAVVKANTTQMGALKGKLQYMSPEQAWGRAVDGRSDIFSLGSVLSELLTGRRLFMGDSEIAILDAVRECHHPMPRDMEPAIPEAVEKVLLKALAKEPADRYQTAGEFSRDIEKLLDKLQLSPGPADLGAFLQRLFHHDTAGHDTAGHDTAGHDTAGYDTAGYDTAGYDTAGHDTVGPQDESPNAPPGLSSETATFETAISETEPIKKGEDNASKISLASGIPSETVEEIGTPQKKSAWPRILATLFLLLLIVAATWWYLKRSGQPGSQATGAIPASAEGEAPEKTPSDGQGDNPRSVEGGEAQQGTGSVNNATSPADAAPVNAAAEDSALEAATSDDTAPVDNAIATSADNAVPENIEQRVEEALQRRAAKLQQDFDQERQRLQRELANAQEPVAEQAPTESEQAPTEPATEEGGGSSASLPTSRSGVTLRPILVSLTPDEVSSPFPV